MDAIETARQAARALRARWEADHPEQQRAAALPITAVAQAQGVAIERFAPTLYPGTLGFLDPDEALIWLVVDQPPPIEHFTLAHELGHWLLHRSGDYCGQDDVADEAVLRPDEAYSPRSQREREANAFAAELLAPRALVRECYLVANATPAMLAQRWAISTEVVVHQLTQVLLNPSLFDTASAATVGQSPALDPTQQAAVTVAAPTLIVAGPGTGKTSTLVGRVRWLVEDQGVAPTQILALTFSRKAAAEMQERIARALGAGFAAPTVATFHRFGADLLRQYGGMIGLRPDFRLVDEIGGFLLLRDLAPQLPLQQYLTLTDPTRHFATLLGAIARAKDALIDPQAYQTAATQLRHRAATPAEEVAAAQSNEIAAVYALYQAELGRRGAVDYGDLVMRTVELLTAAPEVLATVRAHYQQILVDEFQDINRANGIFLRTLAGPTGNIWAVGDANQAIYRFRGASPANIARFHEDYPGARVVTLGYNYRSAPAIVAAANRFAAQELASDQPFSSVALQPVRSATSRAVMVRVVPDGENEVAAIAADIRERHAAGIPYTAMAVLCRTRAHARQVTAALLAADLPATARTDLFEDEGIRDLLGIPLLLAGQPAGLLRAARIAEHAITPAGVQAILAQAQATGALFAMLNTRDGAQLAPGDRAGLGAIRDVIHALRAYTTAEGMLTHYALTLTGIGRRGLTDASFASHLGELLLLAGRFDVEQQVAEIALSAAGRWKAFVSFLRAVRGIGREAAAPPSPGEIVQVLTVHGAKGLEWPIVYLPFLATRRFPLQRRPEGAPSPPGWQDEDQVNPTIAHRVEEACLFYVALTRARDTLIMSRADRYSTYQRSSASPFLEAILQDPGVMAIPISAMSTPTPLSEPFDLALPARTTQQAFTVGEITTYDRCPRQFGFRYGLHLDGDEPATYRRLRQAITQTLRAFSADEHDPDHLLVRFERLWAAESDPADLLDPFAPLLHRYGRETVAQLALRLPSARPTLASEPGRALDVPFGDITVRIELDQITQTLQPSMQSSSLSPHGATQEHPPPSSSSVAVRQRLGRRRSTPEPDLRTLLLVLAQRELTGDPAADTILEHRLDDDELVSVQLAVKDEMKLRERVRLAVNGIRAGEYPARPDPTRCATCPFVLICPMT